MSGLLLVCNFLLPLLLFVLLDAKMQAALHVPIRRFVPPDQDAGVHEALHTWMPAIFGLAAGFAIAPGLSWSAVVAHCVLAASWRWLWFEPLRAHFLREPMRLGEDARLDQLQRALIGWSGISERALFFVSRLSVLSLALLAWYLTR